MVDRLVPAVALERAVIDLHEPQPGPSRSGRMKFHPAVSGGANGRKDFQTTVRGLVVSKSTYGGTGEISRPVG